MRAQELSFEILCVVLAMGIVAYWNGFSTTNTSSIPDYTPPNSYSSGITDISNKSITTADDMANQASGWGMIFGVVWSILDILKYLAIPSKYLLANGVPAIFAYTVQVLFNAVEGLAIIQIWRGIGLKVFK